jgi:uncharacterized alkaline shock family protein YloU
MIEVSNDFENRSTHVIHENGQVGSVQIADEVIAIIAGLAAREVDGVASIEDRSANELAGKLGMKTAPRGVKVTVMDTSVSCDIALNLKYGCNIPELALNVQEQVKNAIENMTGLSVIDVNIRIAGIVTE